MILGVNFSKLVADRMNNNLTSSININNNIRIIDVKESQMITAKGDKALEISFEFSSKYEPNIAQITLIGTAVYVNKEKNSKEILKEWEKEKKIKEDYIEEILSALLNKANVEAILLSREINVPPPIPMPRIGRKTEKQQGDNSYIG